MNKLTKGAMFAVGVAMASHAAHAQIAANDIILGFNQQGVSTSDYTVDLGNANTAVGVGGTAVVDLSTAVNMSSFNSAFAAGPNGVGAGFAGGNNGVGTKDVFVTQLRTALGNPASQAGSATPANPSSASFISTAAASVNAVTPLGLNPSGNAGSWSSQVTPNTSQTTGTPFLNAISINPESTIAGSTIVEDLYQDTRSGSLGQSGWTYDGYFTLTFTGPSSETLTFTPASFVPVPEPATYGLIAGFGLLALSFRRQFLSKNA
jgi:hypothetical protein